MSDNCLQPDLAARIAALEQLVGHLYVELGIVAPALGDAVAELIGPAAEELSRQGDREGAIRAVMEADGVSLVTAAAWVDGFRRSKGW